jgi:NAD(P)-dependent dehydrogenase (short-subunit alcohol dehydrogenase family)
MAEALASHNIFMYAVAPGFVKTDMAASVLEGPDGDAIRAQSPLNRVARPDEVARVVLFLPAGIRIISPAASLMSTGHPICAVNLIRLKKVN